jgi:signal transduction histidine kinase
MKRFSITTRIIVAVVACQLLLAACVTLAAVLYAQAALRAAFDATVESRAASTLALVRYTEDNPPGLLFDSSLLPRSNDPRHEDAFQVLASDGHVVAESPGAEELLGLFASSDSHYGLLKVGRGFYRAVALRGVTVLDEEDTVRVPSRVTVLYAAATDDIDARLQTLALEVSGASLVLLLAATWLGAWMVRRGLAPLKELAVSAGDISPSNWDFRPPASAAWASELGPLIAAIQKLLGRLHESFRQQRDFTSDAAHELKTSVAIVKSSLQSLLQRPRTDGEYRAGLDHLLEDCARLEDLLDRMLRLARAEQRIDQRAEGVARRNAAVTELNSTCETAIARMDAMARGRGVTLEMVSPASVPIRGDSEDLELIWINLLENAIQYSPAGSKVFVRVGRNGGEFARVSIEDSGPGIPTAELSRIFERFHRADSSRARSSGGFGLGLAISKALVDAYGGRIEARNRAQGGAEIVVDLPAGSDLM